MDSKKSTLKKVLRVSAFIIISVFIILFVIGTVHLNSVEKTQKAVEKIRNTKLTLDDVMGKNLPPDPGASGDETIQGIDANSNGIRDDVELEIFKEYPNSAKTRAVLLQYALALQMEMTQDLVNKETVTAVAEEGDRAFFCVGNILSRKNIDVYMEETSKLKKFIEDIQLNNKNRKEAQDNFYKNLGSYTSPNESCDLDLNSFTN